MSSQLPVLSGMASSASDGGGPASHCPHRIKRPPQLFSAFACAGVAQSAFMSPGSVGALPVPQFMSVLAAAAAVERRAQSSSTKDGPLARTDVGSSNHRIPYHKPLAKPFVKPHLYLIPRESKHCKLDWAHSLSNATQHVTVSSSTVYYSLDQFYVLPALFVFE